MSKYIIFAGVNGAGKTTFYTTYPEICQIPRINIDEIVRNSYIRIWENMLYNRKTTYLVQIFK